MTFRRPAAACALLIGLLALAIAPPCSAEAPLGSKQQPPYGLRTDAFRRLLFELQFQPLRTFAELEENPSESLFIMLGDPKCLSRKYFPRGLRSFVEQGGAVLIATDKETAGTAGKELGDLAGVIVTRETLICSKPYLRDAYDGSPYCPFVQPIADAMDPKGWTNALGKMVATNVPSCLELLRLPEGIHLLARLPQTCVVEKINPNISEDPDGPRSLDENGPLFAVGGTVGKGRVLVLADHSIFINRMILPRDNGNLEFAANCLHWLRGGVSSPAEALHAVNNPDARSHAERGNEGVQRNKVLLWDDGFVNPHFEVPLKKMAVPPTTVSEPAVVAAIDKSLAKLEDSDFFNRKILEAVDDTQGGREGALRKVVYLLTLAAVLLLGYLFFWRIRYQLEPSFPFLTDTIDRHQPTLSVLDQRRRAQMRSGNVWEMGHCLAREYFESAGVALTKASPPRVRMAHGSWRQRWRVRRRLARLWRLARGDAPIFLSPAALTKCLRDLEELKTALANGAMELL
ncbi:MAG: DUF4350 domain-containing protein [Gemmataceae bacterium]